VVDALLENGGKVMIAKPNQSRIFVILMTILNAWANCAAMPICVMTNVSIMARLRGRLWVKASVLALKNGFYVIEPSGEKS
jgi:hypothetical protein